MTEHLGKILIHQRLFKHVSCSAGPRLNDEQNRYRSCPQHGAAKLLTEITITRSHLI